MRKLLIGIIILLLLVPSVVSISVNKTSQNRNGSILYVGGSGPGNYTSIQDAIDDAVDGDTIYVFDDSSPYKERVRIDKTINLIGEDRDTTIIESNSYPEAAIICRADNIVISGFTITNVKYPYSGDGIYIDTHNNLIHNNKIMYFSRSGINLRNEAENNNITNNVILHNGYSGIICRGSGNSITWNVIGDNALDYYSNGLRVYRGGYYHHNDFYMNWRGNAHCFAGPQTWDDGSEGNFWDDWEDNPGYPDIYIISTEYGSGDAIDYHPSPTSYLNYTIVGISYSYHEPLNWPIWFNSKVNVEPSSISSWFWDFGDGNTSNEMEPVHSYSKPGIYNISVTVIDSKGQSDTDKSKAYIGDPPHTPIITGPTNCTIGKNYNYTVVADDPDGGLLYYDIEWGDWNIEKIGPYPAGEKINISHCWGYQGTFTIYVQAIDEAEYKSDYGTLNVIVPRNKAKSNSFFSQFLERFPLLREVLLRIINY